MGQDSGNLKTPVGGGGGGDSNIKVPGCLCLVSENGPILNDTFTCKTYPYFEGVLCIIHIHFRW